MNTKKTGFTLIELMVVVAIMGILSSIAYPSYMESVLKSRRADAKGALLNFANTMERYHTTSNSYEGLAAGEADTGSPRIFAVKTPETGSETYYNLTILAANANSFTLKATPSGNQEGDLCGALTITNTGIKSPTENKCW